MLANVAKKYTADIWVQRGDDRANAKSVTSIMNLDVRYNDKVNLVAEGPDAQDAIDFLVPLILSGLGEEGVSAPAPASRVVAEIARPVPARRSDDPNVLLGVTASPGLAVGNVFQVRHQDVSVPETAEDAEAEQLKLAGAIETSKRQLEALQYQLHGQADANKAAIFAAHQEVLDDPELHEMVRSAILKGKSAAFAWQQMINTQAEQLAKMNNPLLAARAADVRDVGQRVMQNLTGIGPRKIDAPANSILVAEELTPSDTANLDRTKVLGFCTTLGSSTSHAAIIARSLDIPAVAGIEPRAWTFPNGTPVILDGSRASLRLNPSAEEMARLQDTPGETGDQEEGRPGECGQPGDHDGRPPDGSGGQHRRPGRRHEGHVAGRRRRRSAAYGVPVPGSRYRPHRRRAVPGVQRDRQALGPDRPLVIRTLDVGGDKPLSYLPIAKEENPFLGERGVRVGLNRPEVLRTQLRAILRAASAGKLLVMFPMVATLTEWRAAKAMFDEERARLGVAADPGRHHGRDPGRGCDGRAVRSRGRFLLGRHQRPDPVHPGHGPRPSQAGVTSGRAEPRRAAIDCHGGQRRTSAWQMGGHLWRHRQ